MKSKKAQIIEVATVKTANAYLRKGWKLAAVLIQKCKQGERAAYMLYSGG